MYVESRMEMSSMYTYTDLWFYSIVLERLDVNVVGYDYVRTSIDLRIICPQMERWIWILASPLLKPFRRAVARAVATVSHQLPIALHCILSLASCV
jgi:hypothetical protein